MRICFLTHTMDKNGGIQRVLHRITEELSVNHEVYIATYMDSDMKPYFSYSDKVKFIFLGKYTNNKKIISKAIRKLTRRFGFCASIKSVSEAFYPSENVEQIENIISEYLFDSVIGLQCSCSILLSRVNRSLFPETKLFGWMHNSFEAYFETPNRYYYGEKKVAHAYLNKLDGIVTLTKHDAKRFNEAFAVNSVCIYNPTSFSDINLTDCNSHKNHIIWCGRLEKKQKGLDYLIEILKQIFNRNETSEWECLIIGDGSDLIWLKNEIQHTGLSDSVKILGNRDDMPELYSSSSILISTSRWEGFGLTILESFQFGVPVVAFNNSGPSEIIDNNINGFLISKYDVTDFSNAVFDLIINHDKRDEFSYQARKKAKLFDIEPIKNEWIRLLGDNH